MSFKSKNVNFWTRKDFMSFLRSLGISDRIYEIIKIGLEEHGWTAQDLKDLLGIKLMVANRIKRKFDEFRINQKEQNDENNNINNNHSEGFVVNIRGKTGLFIKLNQLFSKDSLVESVVQAYKNVDCHAASNQMQQILLQCGGMLMDHKKTLGDYGIVSEQNLITVIIKTRVLEIERKNNVNSYVNRSMYEKEKIKKQYKESSKLKKTYYNNCQSLKDIKEELESKSYIQAKELTNKILKTKPSGDPSKRDTLLHILNNISVNNGKKCLFYDSSQNVQPKNRSDNAMAFLFDDNNVNNNNNSQKEENKSKFVLTLNSIASNHNLDDDDNKDNLEMDNTDCLIEMQESITNGSYHPILYEYKQKLAKAHNVKVDQIKIIEVFEGSINITYVADLTQQQIQELSTANGANLLDNKMQKLFDNYSTLKVHALLFRHSYDISMFDERGNKKFETGTTYDIGPVGKKQKYTQPVGWVRYGLKVLDGRYGNDNTWLDPFQHNNNWYRAYHGTKNAPMNSVDAMSNIYKGGFHNAGVIGYGPGVYCSKSPTFVEKYYAGTQTLQTQNGSKTYKFMLMVAVNPTPNYTPTAKYANCRVKDSPLTNYDDIWVAPTPADIRPYGILIKEV